MRRRTKRIISNLASDLKRTQRELDQVYSIRFRLNYFTRTKSEDISLVDITIAGIALNVNAEHTYEIVRTSDGVTVQFVGANAALRRIRRAIQEA